MSRRYYNPSVISDGLQVAIEKAIDDGEESVAKLIEAKQRYDVGILARKLWLLVDTVSFVVLASVLGIAAFQILKIIGVIM